MQLLLKAIDSLRHKARLKRWPAEHALGRRGEDLAHRHVRALGFTVVARNYRTRTGSAEADLVAWDGPTLVFIEVKSRTSDSYASPDQAVDAEKRRHVKRAAAEYLRRADLPPNCVRFDIISVVNGAEPSIRHIKDAFCWDDK